MNCYHCDKPLTENDSITGEARTCDNCFEVFCSTCFLEHEKVLGTEASMCE